MTGPSSYNSDTISWANENELDESNELNDLNSSNISKNIHNLDTASNSSSPDQVLPHNSGITITNSLGKRVQKRKAFSGSKRLKPKESWVWPYFRQNKIEKEYIAMLKLKIKMVLKKNAVTTTD
ncbi:1098_t:CDS:2 [Gigaspora margarita]|uniref:1098_t:CDS:1 n=1 Tax=Gigaspora margarita TaxID=4874 RepID=A0ABN7V1X3_GIGMA|nr:1098_t:CDS:2 [Gigaspora margarita]